MKKEIKIAGMSCVHCKKHVEEALFSLHETTGVVDLKNHKAIIETAVEDTAIQLVIEEAGYEVTGIHHVR